MCKGLQNATDFYVKTWNQWQLHELDQVLKIWGCERLARWIPVFSGFTKYQKAVLFCSMTSTASSSYE